MHGFTAQLNCDSAVNRMTVLANIFDTFVGQLKAFLGAVQKQQALRPNRWPTATSVFGLERVWLNRRRRSWSHGFYVTQKPIAFCYPCLGSILKLRKARSHLQVQFRSQCSDFVDAQQC